MQIVFAVVFYLAGIEFSLTSFAANMLMVGWFSKLPGLGHLWFVTMIMACYVTFAIIGYKPEVFKKPAIWAVFCLPLHIVVAQMGLPGYFFFNLAVLQPRIFICTKNREMVQCSANLDNNRCSNAY